MPDLKPTGKTKPEKYAKAVTQGKSKKDAKKIAGYSENTSSTVIEKSELYIQTIDKFLLTLEEAFAEHKKNILQSGDKKAKNTALDMYYKLRNQYPRETTPLEGDFEIIIRSKESPK